MVTKSKNAKKVAASFILCGLLLVVLLFWYMQNRMVTVHYLDQQEITHTLILPLKDKKRLAGLMQILFAQNSFAYTILGSKPVSWEMYRNPLPLSNWSNFCNAFSKYNRTLRSGWKTWGKYKHLFPSVCLCAEPLNCYPGLTSILIINEDQFNNVVNKNKRDFEEVLCREKVDGFELLKEARSVSLMKGVLKGHQGLIGTVLGYGRDNSWQFLEGCKKRMSIGCIWENDEESFVEESIELNGTLTEYYLSVYSCPSFAGDPHSAESLSLKTEYLLTKQKVLKFFCGKDFLEASLSLLAGNQ